MQSSTVSPFRTFFHSLHPRFRGSCSDIVRSTATGSISSRQTFANRHLTTAYNLSNVRIPISRITIRKMSSFSNAQTGDKPADPYTQKNLDSTSLKEKVEDLFNFIDKTKFCLLTTQTADSDLLASRAMALAAKV